jgi:DNA polymerase-3 subunit gamma/tau
MLLPSASAEGGALLQRLERMERRLSVAGDQVEAPAAHVREVREAAPAREAATREVRESPAKESPAKESPAKESPAEADAAESSARSPRRAPRQDEPAPQRPARTRPAAGQDDAEPQAPPERVHTPVGQLDAAAVRRIWPEVLDNVKRRRRTAQALLMNVSVQSVDNSVLTLTISSIPLSRLLAQDANTEVVRSAVKDVLGVDWRINVVVDGGLFGGGEAPPPDPRDDDPRDDEPSPPTADRGPARVDPEEAAISLLQSTLGAKRMDR